MFLYIVILLISAAFIYSVWGGHIDAPWMVKSKCNASSSDSSNAAAAASSTADSSGVDKSVSSLIFKSSTAVLQGKYSLDSYLLQKFSWFGKPDPNAVCLKDSEVSEADGGCTLETKWIFAETVEGCTCKCEKYDCAAYSHKDRTCKLFFEPCEPEASPGWKTFSIQAADAFPDLDDGLLDALPDLDGDAEAGGDAENAGQSDADSSAEPPADAAATTDEGAADSNAPPAAAAEGENAVQPSGIHRRLLATTPTLVFQIDEVKATLEFYFDIYALNKELLPNGPVADKGIPNSVFATMVNEASEILHRLAATEAEMQKITSDFDTDNNGHISFTEMNAKLSPVLRKKLGLPALQKS